MFRGSKMAAWAGNADNLRASSVKTAIKNMGIKCVSKLLYTGRHFWNRKCRKKTWWQQEFAVFKCEATANSVTGHVCVNSNESIEKCMGGGNGKILPPPYCSICTSNPSPRSMFA